MSETKNNLFWKAIFEDKNVLKSIDNNGFYKISSKEINFYREARLMTKFDFHSQLPKIFTENDLSILPLSRGTYIISDFENYKKFNSEKIEIQELVFPSYLESLNPKNITSESTALNCAFVSNLIEDFCEDYNIMPTVSGRMSSKEIEFQILRKNNSRLPIKVINSQLEIDGGYEGEQYLSLIEAKNSISDDFLIRQLYFPYKLWKNKISKPVKSIFLTYSNGIFHFREYIFKDSNLYNSLTLVKEKKYAIKNEPINLETINEISNSLNEVSEPEGVPFPQANSFERVINLCELLYTNGFLTKEQITQKYDFDERQTGYYTNAGIYLGLIKKSNKNRKVQFELTKKGNYLFSINLSERQLEFIRLILSKRSFNRAFNLYLEKLEAPTNTEIALILEKSKIFNIDLINTYKRRATTVKGWINWIFDQIEQ